MMSEARVNGADLGAAVVREGRAVGFERYSNGARAREERAARVAKRGLGAGELDLHWLWRRNH